MVIGAFQQLAFKYMRLADTSADDKEAARLRLTTKKPHA